MASEIGEKAGEAFEGAKETTKKAASGASEKAGEVFEGAKDVTLKVAAVVWEKTGEVLEDAGEAAKKAAAKINDVRDAGKKKEDEEEILHYLEEPVENGSPLNESGAI